MPAREGISSTLLARMSRSQSKHSSLEGSSLTSWLLWPCFKGPLNKRNQTKPKLNHSLELIYVIFLLKQSQKSQIWQGLYSKDFFIGTGICARSPQAFQAPGSGFPGSIWIKRTHRRPMWGRWNTQGLDKMRWGWEGAAFGMGKREDLRDHIALGPIILSGETWLILHKPRLLCRKMRASCPDDFVWLVHQFVCFICPSPEQQWYTINTQ